MRIYILYYKHYLEEHRVFIVNYLLDMFGSVTFLTAYITSANSFPQPLDEKEEEYYLMKLKGGDLIAKGVLVERNLRLVAHIVKKYTYPGKDIDDLISIGTVGLIKAIDSFDPAKGTRLATYAARCIENTIYPPRKHLVTQKVTSFF